jgi:hypothetical protein
MKAHALGQEYPAKKEKGGRARWSISPWSLRERCGGLYPEIGERWETKAYALLAFLRHPKPIAATSTLPISWTGSLRR